MTKGTTQTPGWHPEKEPPLTARIKTKKKQEVLPDQRVAFSSSPPLRN